MTNPTWIRVSVAALVVMTATLQLLSLGPWTGTLWGVHFPAFFPRPVGLALILFPALLALLCLGAAPPRRGSTGPSWFPLALVVGFGLVAWLLRSQQTLLGDTWSLMLDLPHGQDFHPRQPLSLFLQQQFLQLVLGTTQAPASPLLAKFSVALTSVLAGMGLVGIAWGICRTVTGSGDVTRQFWSFALLVSQGYFALTFGYVENYTLVTVAMAGCLWCGIRAARHGTSLAPALLVWVLAVALHLSSIMLLPALLFLVGWRARQRRRDLALDLLLVVIALVALDLWMRSRDLPLATALADIIRVGGANQGGGNGLGYLRSVRHLRDYFNELLLIGPIAPFLGAGCVAAAIRWRDSRPEFWFLAIATTTYLAASFLTTEPLLGYARDWDLFAPAGVIYAITAVVGLARWERHAIPSLRAGSVLGVAHLAMWVTFNHSESLASQRFETLPLGLGRTEVVLGNWHLRENRLEEAESWFQRAIADHPYNANAHGLLGALYVRQQRYAEAAAAYEEALVTRPDKAPYRSSLAGALMASDRYEDALPHLLWLQRAEPNNSRYPRAIMEVHHRAGRSREYDRALEQAAAAYQTQLAADPSDLASALEFGVMLAENNRPSEALDVFGRALLEHPDSDAAMFNVASLLMQLERNAEAVPVLESFLAKFPNHSRADQAKRWLDQLRR